MRPKAAHWAKAPSRLKTVWIAAAAAVGIVCLAPSMARADPCEAPLPRPGAAFGGVVEYVGDGDSLCVRTGAGLVEIRIADFNAPELSESGGRAARDRLSRIVLGRRIDCVGSHRSWDRIVALCRLDGTRLGDAIRAAGGIEGGQ